MRQSRLYLASLALILPLCATLFSLWWMLREDGNRAQMKAGAVLNGLLSSLVQKADGAQDDWTDRLEKFSAPLMLDASPQNLRTAPETEPLVRIVALLDSGGNLVYPDQNKASLREREFLARSADLLQEPWVPKPGESNGPRAEGGWQRFFWREGVQLLYWKALPESQGYLLMEIERSAMLADLAWRVGTPPFPDGRRDGHAVVLSDELGDAFLSWPDRGAGESSVRETVQSSIALRGALQGWQFTWTAALSSVPGITDLRLILGLFLGALVAASALLSFTLLRRIDRDVREAGQRVSFVNQVSHELKTPLTNIRLYAEMLEARLTAGGAESKEAQYSSIILRESARLTRLIHNVLTFARLARADEKNENGAIALHPRPTVTDDLVRKVVEGFSASLAEKSMEVSLDLHAGDPLDIDPDICEQLLGNLISNAEKYARDGGFVGVATSVSPGPIPVLKIEVCDRGPGLPPHGASRAFQPFFRFHERHTDGVGGAGLGLAIVRELSALHGGEAGYRALSGGGACFYFTLVPQQQENT